MNPYWMRWMHSRMFSPDDGAGAGAGADPQGQDPQGKGTETQSLDELLKDKALQAEFDRRMSKAQKTALENARQEWEQEARERETEAAKMAKMTADEKAQHERERRENELQKREAALQLRELRAQALDTLQEKGLPGGLADCLNYENAEKCTASMASVEKAFRAAVQEGVEERLRGKNQPGTPGGSENAYIAAMRAAMGLK